MCEGDPTGQPTESGDVGTCADRCGDASVEGCACDDQCRANDNCCDDYEASCEVEPGCTEKVVLMGYWPPTNEMLRSWSRDSDNPDQWRGNNWEGRGYDVYAFFPEFPPDGDPNNDPHGSAGRIGSAESYLRVDYQDTSADFGTSWASTSR
ncbi:MAG: hypothetical protein K0V04_41040 [Deltaproteobacteria bacterium]|nr:hypothetical protein [Deltaproteobacteria bacterium]